MFTHYPIPPEIYHQSDLQFDSTTWWLDEFLEVHPLPKNPCILDACCGTGRLAKYLSDRYPSGSVDAIDQANNLIDFGNRIYHPDPFDRSNPHFGLVDVTHFNESYEGRYDLITCAWSLSHIAPERQGHTLSNLKNYLNENGLLFIIFPLLGSKLSEIIAKVQASEKWADTFSAPTAKRVTYTPDAFNRTLTELDFEDIKVQEAHFQKDFQNREAFRIFLHTAIARQIPLLGFKVEAFLNDLEAEYINEHGLHYPVTLLTASARKPLLNAEQQLLPAYLRKGTAYSDPFVSPKLTLSPEPKFVSNYRATIT